VRAAVGGFIDAALEIGPVGVAESADIDRVRVMRIDEDAPDLEGIIEANLGPGLAAVGGLVDTFARGEI